MACGICKQNADTIYIHVLGDNLCTECINSHMSFAYDNPNFCDQCNELVDNFRSEEYRRFRCCSSCGVPNGWQSQMDDYEHEIDKLNEVIRELEAYKPGHGYR